MDPLPSPDSAFGTNFFGIVDYILLAGSLIICLLVGVYYVYFSKHTNEDLLLGGRDLSLLPVAASLMVSFFSSITILGYPAEIYDFGIEIYMQGIMQAIGMVCTTILFVPFFYPMKITSIYEYLELRYESKWLRRIASTIFICEQIMLGGMILYSPSIALQSFLGFPFEVSILAIGLSCTLYTSLGGIKAVVWTDTFQFFLMLVGLGGILVKAFMEAGGVAPAFVRAYDGGRINLFNFNFDLFQRHNFFNFLLGSGISWGIRTGIHQTTVQRYMSLPNLKTASWAVLSSIPMKLGVMGIMVLYGIAMYAVNADCDPVKSGQLKKKDEMVAQFVVDKLSFIPGALGLFTAILFSGALSSLSSSMNSLAAVTWEDYLSHLPIFRRMTERSKTNSTRVLSFSFGLLAMGVAFACQFIDQMYSLSYAVTGVTVGAINGIFLMGVFLPFVNKAGALGGMLVSAVSIGCVLVLAKIHKVNKHTLPTTIEGCANFNSSDFLLLTTNSSPLLNSFQEEQDYFPFNFYKLSYIMYPTVGSAIGIISGSFISLVTGGFSARQRSRVNRKYVHSSVRRFLPLASADDSAHQFPLRSVSKSH